MQNDAELDEQELLDINNGEQVDENDSESDHRFPYVEDTSWIHWFCKLEGNEFFVEIDEEFIQNNKNLIGINCKKYLETLLSPNPPKDNSINEEYLEKLQNIKEIYGLIHKRFIYTPKGLSLMREKYLNGVYGYCPRILCSKQILLPVGLSEDTKYSRVKVFCPLCEEVYKPRQRVNDLDGAYFGTSFPQAFLMNYPDLNPKNKNVISYIPKLYGFRIFGKIGSKYYCKDKKELEEKKKKLGINEEE
jgi:casein kinase II subunit beta